MAVNEIVEKLRSEEVRLKQQVEKLQSQFAKCESELTQVQAALVALGEKPSAKGASKPMRTRASKREIIAAVADVLGRQGVVETNRLKAIVEKTLMDKGRSRQGFSVRFNESLEDARFVETPGGWRLAAEHETDCDAGDAHQHRNSEHGGDHGHDPAHVAEHLPEAAFGMQG